MALDGNMVAKQRKEHRSQVLLAATIVFDGIEVPVRVRNLSGTGALVEGDRLPKQAESAVLRRDNQEIGGSVAWVDGRYAGIYFDQPAKQDELLRPVSTPAQKPMPVGPLTGFSRPGFRCRPLTEVERRILEG